MPSNKSPAALVPAGIDSRLPIVRGVRVMLDSDLAELYGVPTKVLNQAVDRNLDRFPDDFAFRLTEQEFEDLKSQVATPSAGRGGRRYRPWVFTEHGVAMLSGVIRSPTAIRVNIAIIRTFVRMRRLFAVPGDFVTQLQQLAETVKLHDRQIKAITDLIQKMLEPAPLPPPPARRIGFVQTDHAKNSIEAKR